MIPEEIGFSNHAMGFAEVDEWVLVEQSMGNYKHATAHLRDVTLKQIDGADHLMRTQTGETSMQYQDILVQWLTSRVMAPDS